MGLESVIQLGFLVIGAFGRGAVLQECRKAGYWSIAILTSPMQYGFPQSRMRYYFIGLRLDFIEESGLTCEGLADLAASIEGGFRCRAFEMIPLDDVLVPDAHPYVLGLKKAEHEYVMALRSGETGSTAPGAQRKRLLRKRSSDPCASSSAPKWVALHRQLGSERCTRSNWDDSLLSTYPSFCALPSRVQDRSPRLHASGKRSAKVYWLRHRCMSPILWCNLLQDLGGVPGSRPQSHRNRACWMK